MKGVIAITLVAVLATFLFFFSQRERGDQMRIGIVVPIEHEAMDRMVAGFRAEIEREFGFSVKIDVQNAQGDESIQHAIIEKFRRQKFDLVVPIGTDVALMTLSKVKEQPVLALDLAADAGLVASNFTAVYEADVEPSVDFIYELYPQLHKMTIVYSPSPKIVGQVERVKDLVRARGGMVQPIMIQTLPDLFSIAGAVDRESELIFILKDHVVASGAAVLARSAERLAIPLITSDEGSVAAGATMAIGNSEEQIGIAGGRMAIEILRGAEPAAISPRSVDEQIVFINPSLVDPLHLSALEERYPTKLLSPEERHVR